MDSIKIVNANRSQSASKQAHRYHYSYTYTTWDHAIWKTKWLSHERNAASLRQCKSRTLVLGRTSDNYTVDLNWQFLERSCLRALYWRLLESPWCLSCSYSFAICMAALQIGWQFTEFSKVSIGISDDLVLKCTITIVYCSREVPPKAAWKSNEESILDFIFSTFPDRYSFAISYSYRPKTYRP